MKSSPLSWSESKLRLLREARWSYCIQIADPVIKGHSHKQFLTIPVLWSISHHQDKARKYFLCLQSNFLKDGVNTPSSFDRNFECFRWAFKLNSMMYPNATPSHQSINFSIPVRTGTPQRWRCKVVRLQQITSTWQMEQLLKNVKMFVGQGQKALAP